MRFLFSDFKHNTYAFHFKIGDKYLNYSKSSEINDRELFFETNDMIIIGDVNPFFKHSLLRNPTLISITKNIYFLTNGYVVYVDKNSSLIYFFSDIYGYYHVYHLNSNYPTAVSSEFYELLPLSKRRFNVFAELDILIFNYTLLDRTLIDDINRFVGGTLAIWNGNNLRIEVCNNFTINYSKKNPKQIYPKSFTAELLANIKNEKIEEIPMYLTMTAGFDSRILLACCKSLGFNVNTLTFGQQGNIEIETLKHFITRFVDTHMYLELDEGYYKNIEKTFDEFILKNLDNPVFHSLLEYELINNKLPPINLVTGFMGGEIMIGQTLGAQVTFTKFAIELLKTKNSKKLRKIIIDKIKDYKFIDLQKIEPEINNYIETLKPYFYRKDNYNVLRFIINEEYSKFFGAVNKVFKNKINLITPFVSPYLLDLVLNSGLSFLNRKPFKKHKFNNLKVRILYAKSIEYLLPELASTEFDRQYKIKDLTRLINLPRVLYIYFANHILKRNKRLFSSTTQYELWFENLIYKYLNYKGKVSDIFISENQLSIEEIQKLSMHKKKELLKLMALFYSQEKIQSYA
jgi:hypothetical protein